MNNQTLWITLALIIAVSCASEPEPSPEETAEDTPIEVGEQEVDVDTALLEIRAGLSIGPIQIGVTYADLIEEFGELQGAAGYRRNILGKYPELGIEVALASSEEFTPSLDAVVVAVGTLPGHEFAGPIRPGMTASELTETIGSMEQDVMGDFIFLPNGVSVELTEDGGVGRVGVYPDYTIRTAPPVMIPASTSFGQGATP